MAFVRWVSCLLHQQDMRPHLRQSYCLGTDLPIHAGGDPYSAFVSKTPKDVSVVFGRINTRWAHSPARLR
jgi:hypothetical protein